MVRCKLKLKTPKGKKSDILAVDDNFAAGISWPENVVRFSN